MKKIILSVLCTAMIVGGSAGTVLANNRASEAVEWIGTVDGFVYKNKRDYYFFIPKKTNTYQITLTDLTDDADLYLCDEYENELDYSDKSGSRDEKIVWKMESGKKYYIYVRGLGTKPIIH